MIETWFVLDWHENKGMSLQAGKVCGVLRAILFK